MVLPAFGIISELVSVHSRKPLFGYKLIAFSSLAIAMISFLVWGHHMFTSGQSTYAMFAFSFLTFFVAIPTAIKEFSWVATVWKGSIALNAPMLYTLAFLIIFAIGGLTGVILGSLNVDIHLHDTYFVVAHFHLIMGVAAIFGIFAATFFWFPKMFGRMLNETLGKIHFWITFIGVYAIFMPMHFLGLAGHPRRYSDTSGVNFLAPLHSVHYFITMAAMITITAQLLFLFNLFYSMFAGEKASENPWNATTLEWTIPSPPPFDNFAGHVPSVYRGPYEFSVPGSTEDYIPQHLVPEKVGKAH
jgi:cytochrome c oxidase subunit 1